MINAAILDANGVVTNVVVLDSLDQHPGAVACPDWIGIGSHINDPQPTPVVPPKQLTPLQFMNRFTDAEQLAVCSATMVSAPVKLWYDKMLAASVVDFSDPRVEGGLQALVAAGLLTANRPAEILAA